ncbi:MAG: tRNA uridine-5-carboxymethylaminomethyl(34) synthesis GTPase MnmE [Deltaproteobacteria bacterium]|nr:tRNA uridine-5-carboxymethylaminomethyl(34) synthesis GTPase MnmE [Deltaproteobacteria bacterium]
MYEQDTIAAIATPPGEGGVAIVRVSGIEAERIAQRVFKRSHGKDGKLKSHMLYHGSIRDPQSQNVVDEVLLTVMRQPHSYTGEDVVEVHGHGGAIVSRQVLGVILAQGARQAEAGEFTKRAFLNGKLDLAQAEAVLDLIRAKTVKGAELALNQASGALSKFVSELREELLDILVQVEAAIDFPDEDIELLQRPKLIVKISTLARKINEILATYEWGRLFREGATVCICGRPNVGKSSLLNALLGAERVIVTPIPGTTRDVIEESLNLDGLPVVIWDTAGIRESGDQVEQLGVQLSRKHLAKADAAIVVLDGSENITAGDLELLGSVIGKKRLLAINKMDLPRAFPIDKIGCNDSEAMLVDVSAKTSAGIDALKSALREILLNHQTEPEIAITNVRHRSELIRSAESLEQGASALATGFPPELVAVNLNEAREALEEIIGIVNNEDVLERIFKNYCIGK